MGSKQKHRKNKKSVDGKEENAASILMAAASGGLSIYIHVLRQYAQLDLCLFEERKRDTHTEGE